MSDHESPWVQAVTRARRSVMQVRAAGRSGTGFFALTNGLIVTSQQLVQYEPVVTLVTDEGTSLDAKVVGVDVHKDLAFLLPRQPLTAQPMHPAPIAPRLGDAVAVIGQSAHGVTVTPAQIRAIDVQLEGLAHVQLDVDLRDSDRGAPLIDTAGRVMGIATRPRRSREGDAGMCWQDALLLCDAFEAELAAMDLPAEELGKVAATYTCPACGAAFTSKLDRCLGCGALLPHALLPHALLPHALLPHALLPHAAWSDGGPVSDEPTEGLLEGTRVVKELLATLGVASNRVRRGPRTWRLPLAPPQGGESADVDLCIDSRGSRVVFRTPVVRLPPSDFESFFRLVLTLNDETAGPYRLSLDEDVVFLSTSEVAHSVLGRSPPRLLRELVATAAHFREVLSKAFGAPGVSTV